MCMKYVIRCNLLDDHYLFFRRIMHSLICKTNNYASIDAKR